MCPLYPGGGGFVAQRTCPLNSHLVHPKSVFIVFVCSSDLKDDKLF